MKKRVRVALVGRPNVGKSALFNRILRRRVAIVEGTPGVTRDRLEMPVTWNGVSFLLEDTGGLDLQVLLNPARGGLEKEIQKQAEKALQNAALLVFVVDAKEGLTPQDKEIAMVFKKSGKPFLVAVNKTDNETLEQNADEFYALGVDALHKVSAQHGTGAADLCDVISECIKKISTEEEQAEETAAGKEQKPLSIALVGRPNAGKSSILNCIAGEERVIVDAVPGTTRDSVDVHVTANGAQYVFTDTPGLRRRKKVTENLEYYSVKRALASVQRADVVCLVLDATFLVTSQDKKIAGYVQEQGKGLAFVVNKWDLAQSVLQKQGRSIKGKEIVMKKEALQVLKNEMNFFSHAPVLFTSAKSGWNVNEILPLCVKVFENLNARVQDEKLKQFLKDATGKHSPPADLKIYGVKQAGVMPPAFIFDVNNKEAFHFSYSRFIENRLRRAFGFEGAPFRFVCREKGRKNKP